MIRPDARRIVAQTRFTPKLVPPFVRPPTLRSLTPQGALVHLLDTVFKHEYYALIFNTLDVDSTDDFLMIDPKDLRNTTCKRDADTIRLNPMQIGVIKKVQLWFYSQPSPDTTTWYKIDQEVLMNFVRKYNASGGLPTPTFSTSSSKVEDVLHGVKRDILAFPKFQEDKMWLSWNRGLKAIAATQGVAEVLDPEYVPKDDVEKAKFKNKNTYMFGVFTATLMSNKAKTALQEFEQTHDGQMVMSLWFRCFQMGHQLHYQQNHLRPN